MKKRIFIVSIVLNVFFIVVSAIIYFFFEYLGRKFAYGPLSRRRTSFFDLFPVTSEDVVFLGDSLTDECRWGEMFPEVRVRNRGIRADKTSHLLERLDQVIAGQPTKVFLMIGTNDLGAGVPQEEIIANYCRILSAFRKKSPNTLVFVQSVLPRQAKYKECVENLNNELSDLAVNYGYDFLNLYPDFLGHDGSIKDRYANDELHLTGAGYRQWRDLIEKYV